MVGARAARLRFEEDHRSKKAIAADVVAEYLIGASDTAMIYVSPDLYGPAFEEKLDLWKFNLNRHTTTGLCFYQKNDRLLLASMAPSTPGARIPWWPTRLWGAWLIQIDETPVTFISNAQTVFACLSSSNAHRCTLLFSHPKITPNISNQGLPIMSKLDFSQCTHNQLNNQVNLIEEGLRIQQTLKYNTIDSGNILNYTTRIMKLTWGKLMNQDDWTNWQASEFLQLDQYDEQAMFGNPVSTKDNNAIFHLVWMYAIKTVNGRKKAHCVCGGSSRSGSVQILDKTYANCVDQTSSHLLYAIAAA
jgi:hypothetical protein